MHPMQVHVTQQQKSVTKTMKLIKRLDHSLKKIKIYPKKLRQATKRVSIVCFLQLYLKFTETKKNIEKNYIGRVVG